MRVDAFAIRLRRRAKWEAVDLGVRLCQQSARAVFSCYLIVLAPIVLLALAAVEVSSYWVPAMVLWCAKPWLDRTVLFVLARAAFGQKTSPRDVWEAQRTVWWSQIVRTWTTRRLSPWRSLTQPVYQLEGLAGKKLRKRVTQIRLGYSNTGMLITSAFSLVELALMIALASLAMWFLPGDQQVDWAGLLTEGDPGHVATFVYTAAYALVIAFLEPFYVAGGFALYLNRRVELEAWDVEQELRRAFAR